MKPPKAVIASTGRSGTGYIFRVLKAYGIDAGHESYFCFPWRTQHEVEVDSSWLSVRKLDQYEGIVFHQVRNPLNVLTSLMQKWDDSQLRKESKVWRFREQMMPYRTGDLMRDFMAMIVNMNEEISNHTDVWWKLENIDRATMAIICAEMGIEFDYWKAKEAIESVSTNYNKHHDADYLTWDDIPQSKEKQQLKQQARRYGY